MRVWNDKGFVPYRLEALTPVHIGAGEELSPLQYVVRQVAEGVCEIWLIETDAWLAANYATPDIAKALDGGDMAALRGLMNGAPDLARFRVASVGVGNALGKELAQKRGRVENTAEISFFIRNPFTHLPYLPASSIKGALSTALIDHVNSGREKGRLRDLNIRDQTGYRRLMAEMFGAIDKHSMQGLRLGDIALPPAISRVYRAIGLDISPTEPAMTKTPCEALEPAALNAVGVYGNLRFALVEGRPRLELPDHTRISVEKLGEICNRFYKERFIREMDKFYKKPHLAETGRALEPALKRIEALREGECLLRIGHYSHIECMTVAGDPPAGLFKKGFGQTRTLADSLLPFGWVILKRCELAEYNRGVEATLQAINEKDRQNLAEAEAALKKEAEKAAAREREEAARMEHESFLASMTPEERAIWQLEQPDSIENLASEIYGKLDYYGEFKLKAAQALKKFWQRIDKWQGKALTKRQKEKVRKVRDILGE